MAEERPEQLSPTGLRKLTKERGLHGVTGPRKQEPAEKLMALSHTRVQQAIAELSDSPHSVADGGTFVSGLLEIVSEDDFRFLRSANYLPGEEDVYVSPLQIWRSRLRIDDLVTDVEHLRGERECCNTLLYMDTINGVRAAGLRRANFGDMTSVFPDKRIPLATGDKSPLMLRIVDLITPIGKGQRDLVAVLSEADKTTLFKETIKTVRKDASKIHLIVLLIDERPEEVTDIKEYIAGPEVGVIYPTFDREPEQHRRVSEMVVERARHIVEQHGNVMTLLDSIMCLARTYDSMVTPSGRILSNGLDPASLYMSKRFFGAVRSIRGDGGLTIPATAFVETGNRMDDVIYEEFEGTGNMELTLDRRLAERRTFPAISVARSGTRREEFLLSTAEREGVARLRNLRGGGANRVQTEASFRLFWESANNHTLLGKLVDSKQKLFPGLQRQRKHAMLWKLFFNRNGSGKAVRRFHQYQAKARWDK